MGSKSAAEISVGIIGRLPPLGASSRLADSWPDTACSASAAHSTIGTTARKRGPESQEHRIALHPDY